MAVATLFSYVPLSDNVIFTKTKVAWPLIETLGSVEPKNVVYKFLPSLLHVTTTLLLVWYVTFSVNVFPSSTYVTSDGLDTSVKSWAIIKFSKIRNILCLLLVSARKDGTAAEIIWSNLKRKKLISKLSELYFRTMLPRSGFAADTAYTTSFWGYELYIYLTTHPKVIPLLNLVREEIRFYTGHDLCSARHFSFVFWAQSAPSLNEYPLHFGENNFQFGLVVHFLWRVEFVFWWTSASVSLTTRI